MSAPAKAGGPTNETGVTLCLEAWESSAKRWKNTKKETKPNTPYNLFHEKDSAFASVKTLHLTSSFLLPQGKRASCLPCLTLHSLPSRATGSSSPCRLWQPLLMHTATAKWRYWSSLQRLLAKRRHPKGCFLLSSVDLKWEGGRERAKQNPSLNPKSRERWARRHGELKASLGGGARPESWEVLWGGSALPLGRAELEL